MSNLSRLSVSLLASGLAFLSTGIARAAESPEGWSSVTPAAAAPVTSRPARLAMLPPLPSVPPTYAITPERRALLNTIRYAEGTWANGHEVGYRIMFGGSLMNSLDRHPNRVMHSVRYSSAAAGAYQFMPFTWNMVQRALGVRGFHPDAQDQGALFLVQRRKALHLADRGELSPDLVARLAPEWASFPTLAGSSYYGQPVKRYDDLRRFYERNLAELRQAEQRRQWEEVAIRQVPRCDDDSLSCKLELVSQDEDPAPERPSAARTAEGRPSPARTVISPFRR